MERQISDLLQRIEALEESTAATNLMVVDVYYGLLMLVSLFAVFGFWRLGTDTKQFQRNFAVSVVIAGGFAWAIGWFLYWTVPHGTIYPGPNEISGIEFSSEFAGVPFRGEPVVTQSIFLPFLALSLIGISLAIGPLAERANGLIAPIFAAVFGGVLFPVSMGWAWHSDSWIVYFFGYSDFAAIGPAILMPCSIAIGASAILPRQNNQDRGSGEAGHWAVLIGLVAMVLIAVNAGGELWSWDSGFSSVFGRGFGFSDFVLGMIAALGAGILVAALWARDASQWAVAMICALIGVAVGLDIYSAFASFAVGLIAALAGLKLYQRVNVQNLPVTLFGVAVFALITCGIFEALIHTSTDGLATVLGQVIGTVLMIAIGSGAGLVTGGIARLVDRFMP